MANRFNESGVESAGLEWLTDINWGRAHGPEIATGESAAERQDYNEVLLAKRLKWVLARLNPTLPKEPLEDAFRKLTRLEGPDLVFRNRAMHRMLVDGLNMEFKRKDGSVGGGAGQSDRL